TAQELRNPARGNVPPLRNLVISRVATFHRSEIAESHAREPSTARESQNLTRGNVPSLRNCRIPRAGAVYPSENTKSYAQDYLPLSKTPRLTHLIRSISI